MHITDRLQQNATVFKALVYRDCIMIKKRLRGSLIDSLVQLFIAVVLMGGLLPTMGIPATMIAPLYLGSQVAQIFFLGMSFGLRNLFDLRYARLIDYRLTLPIDKSWLFASYIVYFMLEALIITLPLMTIGIMLLGERFIMIAPNYIASALLYCMSLVFLGTFFLALSFYYDYDWFLQNIWPRRLTFLFGCSPVFFTWFNAKQFAPNLASIMLLSPMTYIAEGLRSGLIGTNDFISIYVCIPMTACFIAAASWFLTKSIIKRLDPV